MALHRTAQAVYFLALGVLASAMGREQLPESRKKHIYKKPPPDAALAFERAMVDALEGLNTYLKAVITI
jgi:hypothetical protein